MLKDAIEDKAARSLITVENCPERPLHRVYVGAACGTCGTAIPPGPFTPAEMSRYFTETPISATREYVVEPDADELAAIAAHDRARADSDAAGAEWQRLRKELSTFWRTNPETINRVGNVVRDERAWAARRDALEAKVAEAKQAWDDAVELAHRAAVKRTQHAQRRTARVRAAMLASNASPKSSASRLVARIAGALQR